MKKHIIKVGNQNHTIYQDGKMFFTRKSATFYSLEDIRKALVKDWNAEQAARDRDYARQEKFACGQY
ncbi:hypothetical protein [uncultured Mediterranean phage uvDeep-CGR2-KM21-C345]|nr:hypothetical protein [uncultured Mediterranean phage uvDeep-CGR2-KM21-C345]